MPPKRKPGWRPATSKAPTKPPAKTPKRGATSPAPAPRKRGRVAAPSPAQAEEPPRETTPRESTPESEAHLPDVIAQVQRLTANGALLQDAMEDVRDGFGGVDSRFNKIESRLENLADFLEKNLPTPAAATLTHQPSVARMEKHGITP